MALLEIAGILIITATALLLVPVNVNLESDRSAGNMHARFSISWLLFNIRYSVKDKQTEFLVLSRRIASKQQTAQPETGDKPKKEKAKFVPSGRSIQIADVKSLAGPVLQLLRSVVQTIRFRYVQFDTTYGFHDPACTGMLTGYLHALQGSLQHNISFTPDFTRIVLDWDLKLSSSITPFWVFPPIVKFAVHPQVLRTGWKALSR
jgi:hypothetical protein